jgi:hypothetical protein
VHTQLEAISDSVRQLSTANVNPDELMTVEQVAETLKVAATTGADVDSLGPVTREPVPDHQCGFSAVTGLVELLAPVVSEMMPMIVRRCSRPASRR